MTIEQAPTVSVVIPAYNAAAYIAETLDSVFAQTYPAFEVVVVNDGSPDTEALDRVLAPFMDRITYVKQDNRGPGGARNTGIAQARGEYVAFLDSDDLWLREFLEAQVRLLEWGGYDLVYADAELFGAGSPLAGRTCMELSPSRGEVTFEALVSLRCIVVTSCVLARRSALVNAGLFDEAFFHSEDFDLWARLAHGGGRIGYQREVLARHRIHPASLSATGSLIRGQMRVSQKLRDTLSITPDQRILLERHISWCQAQLQLSASKVYLAGGRYRDAAAALRSARVVLGGWKLSVSAVALTVAPQLLRRAYLRSNPVAASLQGGPAHDG